VRLVWSQLADRQVDEIRELLVGSYRVIYRRSEAVVEIAVVRHQARRFDEKELAP